MYCREHDLELGQSKIAVVISGPGLQVQLFSTSNKVYFHTHLHPRSNFTGSICGGAFTQIINFNYDLISSNAMFAFSRELKTIKFG